MRPTLLQALTLAGLDGRHDVRHGGIGAKLQIKTGTTTHVRYVKAGSSYLGQNDMRVHVGVGDATLIDRLEVRWPSGQMDTATRVPVNSVVTVVEGEGISRRVPFVAKR